VLGAAFSFGVDLSGNGYLVDPNASCGRFVAYTLVAGLALFAACEGIAAFQARRRPAGENGCSDAAPAGEGGAPVGRASAGKRGVPAGLASADLVSARNSRLSILVPRFNVHDIVLFAAIMLAFWGVWMVALYPGSMNIDTVSQIKQSYIGQYDVYIVPWIPTHSTTDAWFSDHHPFLDTLVFGAFVHAFDWTGSWNAGVYAFVLVQCCLTTAAFSAAVAYLRRAGAPLPLCLGVFLFFCLMPFYPIYGMTMLKDSLYSFLFVVYFLFLAEIVRTRGAVFQGARRPGRARRLLVWFIVVGVLLALTKKTGVYSVLVAAVIGAIVYRRCWKAFAAQALASWAVIWLLFPFVVFPLAHVVPGQLQEAVGFMFQQTARYVVDHSDEVTNDERQAIDAVLGFDDLAARYEYNDADPVKFWYRYDTVTTGDLANYLRVWAVEGARHPETYAEATLSICAPYLNASGVLGVHGQTGDIDETVADLVYQPAELDGLREPLLAFYRTVVNAPGLAIFFRVGPYATWIPLLLLCYGARNRSGLAFLSVALLVALGFCLICPIFHSRYALPLIYTAPVALGLLFSSVGAQRRPE
jgi:hypothetical protein